MDKPELHPFAAAMFHYLKDKEVEIYCGHTKTTLLQADAWIAQKSLIRGKIKDAYGYCLVVECKKPVGFCTVFVNVDSVVSVIPIEDSLFMKDVFEDEHELKGVRG